MRQVMSTALVALIIGALAGATMGAVAQSEPAAERAIDTAGLNADKVDGRHAVKYTNQMGVRRGKLVAKNNKGELPSNIVRPFWGLVRNMPAGFADGVDNEGVTGISITTQAQAFNLTTSGLHSVDVACPTGNVIGGGFYAVNAPTSSGVQSSYALNTTTWRLQIYVSGPNDSGTAYATCLTSAGSAVAASLTPAARDPKGDRK